MKSSISRLMGIFLVPLLLSACIPSGNDSLQNMVNQHSQAIQQLQSQVSGVQPAQANNWSQVQTLRQEMAAIKGALDNLNNATANLGGVPQLGDIIARHDRALRMIESQLALNLQLNQPVGATGYTPNVQNTQLSPVSPTQMPPAMTQTPAQNINQAKPTSTDTAQVLYDTGINNFNTRNYAVALNSFVDFTEVYPNHPLAANAWFWQGESHYQMRNYAAAALAYQKVIDQYPNNIKAPAAYLKQGMSFIQLNKKDAAKERLSYLARTYPKAPEARRAEQELKTL